MRIGIDAHIIQPTHKRYDVEIARYTENLVAQLLEADKKREHTWVLFFDSRMKNTKKFTHDTAGKARPNVEVKYFPFIQYRAYLPVVYSHMLISAFLTAARLDIFHSPEGLIPFVYPGKIVTTFHYVPTGESESNLFVRTFMLGARTAFAQLCKRAKRIIVRQESDKKILVERHGYPADRVLVMDYKGKSKWTDHVKQLMTVYKAVTKTKTKARNV